MSEQELCSAPWNRLRPPHPPRPGPCAGWAPPPWGLVLVVAGIAITAGMLNPDLDFSLLCKLSPLVLVALGVEVLIAACTARQAKLKYDVLSMFVCAFLIIAALCGTAAAPMLGVWGPACQKAVRQLGRPVDRPGAGQPARSGERAGRELLAVRGRLIHRRRDPAGRL